MGISYYTCDHCEEVTDDHRGGNEAFQIEGWPDEYTVCRHCVAEHQSTKKRHVFGVGGVGVAKLEEWLADKEGGDCTFFVRKSELWDGAHKEAWIGEGLCGGMTEQEAKEAIRRTRKLKNKCCRTILVGWRNHEVEDREDRRNWFATKMTRSALKIQVTDVGTAYQMIQDYAKGNHLENTPFLIVGDALKYNHESDLEHFCFPERDKSILCAANLEQVKSILNDVRHADPEDVTFLPSQKFIDVKKADAKQMVERAQQMLEDLEKMERALKNRNGAKPQEEDKASDDDTDAARAKGLCGDGGVSPAPSPPSSDDQIAGYAL